MTWIAARVAAVPPGLQDTVLAVALVAVNVGTALPYASRLRPSGHGVPALVVAHPQAVALTLLVLQAAPLAGRRRWPLTAAAAIGLPRVLYDLWGFGYAPLPLGPAIIYYTIMQRCPTGVRVVVSAGTLGGIFVSQTSPGHHEPYDFFVVTLIFAAAGMAGILSRTRAAYLAEVEERARRAETERDQQAALAAARERAGIARELHDVVAHHVSLMAVQAEAAGSLLPGQPAAAARSVEIIGETARQALTELRRLLGVLRGPGEQPEAAPSPSLRGLDAVLGQVRGAGLAVRLTVEGTPSDLAPGVDLAAYRIVQEALTNALRHSAAAQADVSIRYEPGYVMVSVTDAGPASSAPASAPASASVMAPADQQVPAAQAPAPGQALAVAHAPAQARAGRVPGGFGLAGITERVASCGGTLTVGPTEAGGFAVTARLPAL